MGYQRSNWEKIIMNKQKIKEIQKGNRIMQKELARLYQDKSEVEPSWYTAFVFLMGMLFMGLIVWLVMWLG